MAAGVTTCTRLARTRCPCGEYNALEVFLLFATSMPHSSALSPTSHTHLFSNITEALNACGQISLLLFSSLHNSYERGFCTRARLHLRTQHDHQQAPDGKRQEMLHLFVLSQNLGSACSSCLLLGRFSQRSPAATRERTRIRWGGVVLHTITCVSIEILRSNQLRRNALVWADEALSACLRRILQGTRKLVRSP